MSVIVDEGLACKTLRSQNESAWAKWAQTDHRANDARCSHLYRGERPVWAHERQRRSLRKCPRRRKRGGAQSRDERPTIKAMTRVHSELDYGPPEAKS